jgi:hypothetical protein
VQGDDLANEIVSRCETWSRGEGVGISARALDVVDASDAGDEDADLDVLDG